MLFFSAADWCQAEQGKATPSVPLIYCSDLFHPPDDPDDWFDVATVFSIQEFDLRGIVLDQGQKQLERPGRIPIEQLIAITGRKAPIVIGLPDKLRSPSDKGLDQPEKFQEGIKLLLNILEKADTKVTVITVGSLRDVCAAFNRSPELLKAKIDRLYISAGHSDAGNEYNVDLDPQAYVGVMRSSLPIYWLPCFGKEPYVSRWQFKQGELLDGWSLKLQNYFAYGLMKVDPNKTDPVLALDKPMPPDVKEKVWAMDRSMWSTPSFIDAANRTMVSKAGRRQVLPAGEAKTQNLVFGFVPAKVSVRDNGQTRFEDIAVNSPDANMRIFRFEGTHASYNEAMKQALDELLKALGR